MFCESVRLGLSAGTSAHPQGHLHQMFWGSRAGCQAGCLMSACAVDTSTVAHSDFYSRVSSFSPSRLWYSPCLTSGVAQALTAIRTAAGCQPPVRLHPSALRSSALCLRSKPSPIRPAQRWLPCRRKAAPLLCLVHIFSRSSCL